MLLYLNFKTDTYEKILVPTDFSKAAQWALEVAAEIAKKAAAEIILLHIVEQPTKESFNVEGQVGDHDSWEDRLFTFKLLKEIKFNCLNKPKKLKPQAYL